MGLSAMGMGLLGMGLSAHDVPPYARVRVATQDAC